MPVNSERLFVDLLFRSSKKYPSWDPEVPVHVGDYGRITQGKRTWMFWKRSQGTFVKEGNIYDENMAKEFDIPPPKEHGDSSMEGVTWITSNNVREIGFDVDAGADAGIAECKVKAAFTLSSGRGAILAMVNDTITTIDPPGRLRRLLDSNNPKLKGQVIVSEVHQASSYARYLAFEGARTVSIGLSASDPVTMAAASVEAKWKCSAQVGNFKSKVGKDPQKRTFYPLFRLVSLEEKAVSTGLRGELDEDPPLPDAEPPWEPVGDEGRRGGSRKE